MLWQNHSHVDVKVLVIFSLWSLFSILPAGPPEGKQFYIISHFYIVRHGRLGQ